eukprot:gene11786-5123_t
MSKRVLLPTEVKPEVYKLQLEPDLEKCTYEGQQEVSFKLLKPTKRITLNSKNLEITECYVVQGDSKHVGIISFDLENQYAMFDFEKEITKDGSLFLKFNGILNDQMAGFYRSKYTNTKGETKYLATTQFESTDARRCFPCWDEPSLKSIFEVTLIVPEDRIAISNMDCTSGNSLILEGASSTKKKVVKFSPSPIMSTYLLAFIVGEFDYVEGKTKDGLPVRCFVPLGKKEQGDYGLEIACKVIPLFEEYFHEKYPLPKLDLIAIPDFAAGAMENWGLLTYRETALLFDPKNSSASIKQRVALVVAHECAHQWFGNLVTMEWWEQLWLNEGFATWVEYLAVDELYPDWNIFEQFVDGEYAAAQRLDGLEASHPIEVEVNSAMEIDEIFDGISYAKGCAVIRMLAEYVGLETFKEALRLYLSNHKYSNASSKDLWDAVAKKSGKDIETLMNSWTRKMGFPLVEVKEESVSNGKKILSVKQHRYLSSGFKEDDSLWHIPLGYVTDLNSTPVFTLLTEKESTVEVDANIKWIKFNPGQTGFYRVNYTENYYDNLSVAIKSKELSSIDRLGVQNDVTSLAASGNLKTSQVLKILRNYSNEDNYIVWSGVSANLSAIWKLIKYEDFSGSFSKLAQELYKPLGNKLGWEAKKDESHLNALLRSLIISNLGEFDDKETIETAKEKFLSFVKDNSVVSPDLRAPFYQIMFKHGGEEAYNAILKIFETTTLNEERVRILGTIGCVSDEKKLQEVLKFGWSDAVKRQDTFYLFRSVASNKKGRDLAYQFFLDNYGEMVERYSSGLNFISYFVKICCGNFTSEEKAKEVEEFFKKNPTPAANRAIQQSIETIKTNSAWLKRDGKDIEEFLKNL